jgi:hypothetical protein
MRNPHIEQTMTAFTITQIEQAINFWRSRNATGDDAALCAEARKLADIYGTMIYEHMDTVDATALSSEQAIALDTALRTSS